MPSFATPEGTARFARRFTGRAAEGHFRERFGLLFSSIGIGTYLGNHDAPTDQAYTAAVIAAVNAGANLIDSAINYRFQRSERSISAALQQLLSAGFQRDELILCTKGGFLTPDGDMPTDPRAYFAEEYIRPGIVQVEDIVGGGHCMAPRFLENQLQRSLRNLGVDCLDVYYVHNPESQLAEVSRQEFHKRLRAAFEFLESAVAAGHIRFYGAATWNAFRLDEKEVGFLSLNECLAIAREVAGKAHHFRFVQLPFNLAMVEALGRPNQSVNGRQVPMVEAARELNVALIASASLMQGQVARNLPSFVGQVFGCENDLHAALQFVRSTPGITAALVGMGRPEHAEFNLKLVGSSPAPFEQYVKLFGQSE